MRPSHFSLNSFIDTKQNSKFIHKNQVQIIDMEINKYKNKLKLCEDEINSQQNFHKNLSEFFIAKKLFNEKIKEFEKEKHRKNVIPLNIDYKTYRERNVIGVKEGLVSLSKELNLSC